ncbi:MAG: hypothetical protein KC560_11660, partial [Myxococcales bacterium]|nr:hypothetical protein [Myxococcales bacterium]
MPTTRRDDERAGPQDGAPTRARRAARALGYLLLAAVLALGAVALAITAVRSGVGRGALRETVEREVGDA